MPHGTTVGGPLCNNNPKRISYMSHEKTDENRQWKRNGALNALNMSCLMICVNSAPNQTVADVETSKICIL